MGGLREGVDSAVTQLKAGITSLKGSPRDLWLVFVLKVLESYNYFSLSRIFTLYLTEQYGIDDVRAGTYYGLWGTLLVGYGFALGGAIDFLGIRRSLLVCFLMNLGSRVVMSMTTSSRLLIIMLLGPNAMASCLGVPVLTIAVKRFTNESNRGFAFSLFYTLMNVAALSQGMVMDLFRITFKHGFSIAGLSDDSLLNNGSRLFMFSGCVSSLAGMLIAFTVQENQAVDASLARSKPATSQASLTSSGELELPTSPTAPLMAMARGEDSSSGGSIATRLEGPAQSPPARISKFKEMVMAAKAVALSRGFWKFMAMCIFTVNLKSLFRHLDATLPKYQLRAFGCDTPIGLIYSINPAMIVLLVPIIGAMTTGYSHFDMIHAGSYISALSPLWIVAFATEWSTAAFVATLSIGEAIWSPRWYDYSMGIAPSGREGVFTALTSAPLFAAMLPTGMLSGYLLHNYCPDTGQCTNALDPTAAPPPPVLSPAPEPTMCDGRSIWGIITALTLMTPLAILAFQRWIKPAEGDFERLREVERVAGRAPRLEGEQFDFNEADPLGLVENVWEARVLSADCETTLGVPKVRPLRHQE